MSSWQECVGCRWLARAPNAKDKAQPYCLRFRRFFRGPFLSKRRAEGCFRAEKQRISSRWAFPAHIAVTSTKTTLRALLLKLNEEQAEASMASLEGKWDEVDVEVMDVYHVCETYLRKRALQGVDLDAVRDGVVLKNKKRGYYGHK